MTVIQNGLSFEDDGALNIYEAADPGSDASSSYGMRTDSVGIVYVETSASSVPSSTDPRRMGFAFTPAGKLFVTKTAVGATSYVQNGIAVNSLGQVHITTAAPSPAFSSHGFRVGVDGVLYVKEN